MAPERHALVVADAAVEVEGEAFVADELKRVKTARLARRR